MVNWQLSKKGTRWIVSHACMMGWSQSLYRFLNPKLKTFSRLEVIKMWSIETFEKTQEQSFFHDALQLNKIWPTEKKCTHKAPAIALKEKKNIFPNFTSIFQTFSRSGKLLGKFQDFFKNSRLCTNPVKCRTLWGDVFFKLSADQLLALIDHRLNYFWCFILLH